MEQRGLVEEMVRLGDHARFGSVYGGGKRVFRLDFSRVESRYAASSGVLAKVASILHLPITFSVVPEGGRAPELIPALKEYAASGNVFPRVSADPCLDRATLASLAASGRKTLVIAGFATEVVTLHAELSAIGVGYAVQVALDACGGMSERTERAALAQIEKPGGVPTSVVTLATLMSPDFSAPPGAEVFKALQALRLA